MYLFLYVIATHFLADFVLQSHWMASNKSKRDDALALHVLIYSTVMTIGAAFLLPGAYELWFVFYVVTFVTHFITDYYTSRITSRLGARALLFIKKLELHPDDGYCKQEAGAAWHWFFVVIGFDQLVHYATLAITLRFLGVG